MNSVSVGPSAAVGFANGCRRLAHVAALVTAVLMLIGRQAACAEAASSAAQSFDKRIPQMVKIEQRLGERLPLDAGFVDDLGQNVKLGDYFNRGKPIVLVLAYYRCPSMCNQVLNGLLRSSQAIPERLSADYDIVTVSFDPTEKPEIAAAKKRSYVKMYRREGAQNGWHFLTGSTESIERLTEAVGFRYHYDPVTNQYAHASGIMVCTPDGKLSRYFYDIVYVPDQLRMALIESSQGSIGSPVDVVLLLCYHYDPRTGKYGFAIARVIQAAGWATLLGIGGFLAIMFRRERKQVRLGPEALGVVKPPPDINKQ